MCPPLPITQLCNPQGFITFEVIIDLIFWGDIFVCFRTSYHEYGKEIFDPRLIAKHYLKYWLSERGKCHGCSARMCFKCVVKCKLSLGSREPLSSQACVLWTPDITSRSTCYLAFRDILSQLWVVIKRALRYSVITLGPSSLGYARSLTRRC